MAQVLPVRTIGTVASDDEFKKAAEDLGALFRSLGDDLRQSFRAHRELRSGAREIRDELRETARRTRSTLRDGWYAGQADWAARSGAYGPGDVDGDPGASGTSGPGQPGPPGRPGQSNGPAGWSGGPFQGRSNFGGRPNGRRGRYGWEGPYGPPVWDRPHGRTNPGHGGGRYPAPGAPPRPRPAKAAQLPFRHRHDGSTVFGLVVLVIGLGWMATTTHVADIPWRGTLAIALILLGGAMVLTARTDWSLSRRSWPVMLGLLLLAGLVAGVNSLSWPTVGPRSVSYDRWSAIPRVIQGGIGPLRVDLSGLPKPTGTGPGDAPRLIQVRNDVGPVSVRVPADQCVHVDAVAGAGVVNDGNGPANSGIHASTNENIPDAGCRPTMDLSIRDSAGPISVSR
jgi:hypothetical protein